MAGEMTVQLQANLTADPELAQAGGKTVCKLRLAHNTRTKRGDSWENDETWWIDGTVWPRWDGDQWPENVYASLGKGDTVDLSGLLKREPWESRQGNTGISYRLSVRTVAPSLQRATVQITKNERANGQQQASGWGGQSAQGQQGWGQRADEGLQAGYFDDEQPF